MLTGLIDDSESRKESQERNATRVPACCKQRKYNYRQFFQHIHQLKQKVEYVSTVIDFLESTIKQISNRGFQIKNAIDWRKFTSGAI